MLYRPFLREAWRLTWEHKSLWILHLRGAHPRPAGGGRGVASVGKSHTNRITPREPGGRIFPGLRRRRSIGQLAVLGPERTSFIVIVSTLTGILLIIIATLSQGALLLGIQTKTRKILMPFVEKQVHISGVCS